MIFKLVQYLRKKKTGWRLPTELQTDYDAGTIDRELVLVMMAGRARDPVGARRLLDQYGVKTAADLLPLLPSIRPTRWQDKLLQWLQRLEGSSEHNPYSSHYREIKYREPRRDGIRRTDLSMRL